MIMMNRLATCNHEDEEDQDSSANNHEEEQVISAKNHHDNNLGKNQVADQRSNSENRETEVGQSDKYRTRYGRRVIRRQRCLEVREQERASTGIQKTAMSSIAEEKYTESNEPHENHSTDYLLCPPWLENSCICSNHCKNQIKRNLLKS